jgi:hypothetical protein
LSSASSFAIGPSRAPTSGFRSKAGCEATAQLYLEGDWWANPFCDRGRIKDPTRFFDRRRILRELSEMLAGGNSVSLVGESEIGKSSVLYYLYQTNEASPQTAESAR